jgi:hypothetical protein
MALRWKQQPKETGLRRVGAGPRPSALRDNDKEVLWVAPLGGGWRGPIKGWYWYGCGENTSVAPWPTEIEAKAAAMAFYKARAKA